jgi:hypothetical protein
LSGSGRRAADALLVLLATATCAAPPGGAEQASLPVAEAAPRGVARVHVDRLARRIHLVDAGGTTVETALVGIGRGGLATKQSMEDEVTPTGTFTVDLVLHRAGTKDAVSAASAGRFASVPELARLVAGDPGLPGLFANMDSLDFDGDGAADHAYGDVYVGLDAPDAVVGPKLRRHSRTGTPYWYSIALHGTPDPANLGAARSGGCVHVDGALLERLIDDGVLAVGATVTIADGGPG